MDIEIRLILLGLAIIVAGYVNYSALSHLEEPASRTRTFAILSGGIGLVFVILSPFAPLLALAFFVNEGSEKAVRLLPALWICALRFTVLSLISLIAHAIANKKASA